MNILVVVPARGGSKGIPRKNLRLLNGKPLLYYAINTALSSRYQLDVYVSSEDDEILNSAIQFGSKIHKRDNIISDDETTLDPVVFDCYTYVQKIENVEYDYIITMQPTSPLLSVYSLDSAIAKIIENSEIDTIIAAKNSTHLTWRNVNNKFFPNYKERVNRQYLTPVFTETGAFLITKKGVISKDSRIGDNVELFILENGEEIDLDTYEDWSVCEYCLKRKHILFVVTGNKNVGLGHVYNTLLVANDILNHKISFIVDQNSQLAFEKIASKNYPVKMQKRKNIIDDIKEISPDIVINDILDTATLYMSQLKHLGVKIINFEDLGEGAKEADLVINAIYPEKKILPNHYFGYDYFILRDEFIYSKQKQSFGKVKNILITFGGVDPNNYTKKVIDTIYTYCVEHDITITVIAGFGYNSYESIENYNKIQIKKSVTNISKYILESDLIFTSAGRTAYEIASIGVPAIILSQNERETTHFFASGEHGFLNLGIGYDLSNKTLFSFFEDLVLSRQNRLHMSRLMRKTDLKQGRKTVIKLLQNLIEE